MPRRAFLLAGGFLGFLILGALFFAFIELYLTGPVDRLYQAAVNVADAVPQDWLWALVIGLVILFSLRAISGSGEAAVVEESPEQFTAENLSSWLVLLQEREKGPYFAWKVAHRLAELSERIGPQTIASAPEELQAYLRTGLSRRTIHHDEAASDDHPAIQEVISHLEWSVNSEQEG